MDLSELSKLARDVSGADRALVIAARSTVKSASFAVEKRVKVEMPIDKGRARASWGHWTSSDIVKPGSGASAADAVWATQDGGLTIVQGSNVPYIEALNDGHSKQRPMGFIDRAALVGQLVLERELGMLDPLRPVYQRMGAADFLSEYGG